MYSYNYYPVTTCIIQILFIYDEGVCTYIFHCCFVFPYAIELHYPSIRCICLAVKFIRFNLLVCDTMFFDQVWLRLINKSAANFSSTLYASFADHHNFLMILDPNTYYYFRSLLFYQGFFCVTLLIPYGYDDSPSEVRSFAKFMQYFFVILCMHKFVIHNFVCNYYWLFVLCITFT